MTLTRVSSSRQFIMCSNISTETMRSNCACGSNTFMSAVTTRRFVKPRAAASPSMYSRCECEFDTAVICEFGNCRAIHSDSEPQPQPSSRIDCPSARSACSTVWRSASSSASCRVDGRLLVEARGIFAVRAEHVREECRRHLVMLGIGGVGVFGDGARRHLAGERGVASRHRRSASRVAVREHSRWMRGADDDVRQRHAFGGADDRGDEAHVDHSLFAAAAERTCWCATDSRDSARRASAASAASSGGMPVTWTRIQYMKTGASSVAQPQAISRATIAITG